MKTTIKTLLILFIFFSPLTIFSQGEIYFDTFEMDNWYTGEWVDSDGRTWDIENCEDFTIYGPTRSLVRFGHHTGTISTEVSGGLGTLSFALYHLWGETDPPQSLEVFINGESYGNFIAGYKDVDNNNQNDSTTIYSIEDINKEGDVTITLTGNSNLGLDTVKWTGFVDTVDPDAPGQATGYNIAKTNFSVSWPEATDNSGVASYDVYLDGDLQGNTENTHFDITEVDPGQTYTITVVAIDLSGNRSVESTPADITTLPADAPGIGYISDIVLFLNSGENFILLPEIDDGNPGENEDLTVTAVSNDETIVEIIEIHYNKENTCGYLKVQEKGKLGNTTIDLEIADATTTIEQTITVAVEPYSKPGINFEVHDLVFWDEIIPTGSKPVFDTIIDEAQGPPPGINWDKMELTVSQDCDGAQCDGHDFITLMYRGYVVPPANGSYTFYMKGVADYGLWLSPDENFENAEGIAVNSSQQHEPTGNDEGDGTWSSDPISLEAGKVYAIYGINWTVHTTDGGILWEGPGVNKDYIQAENMMYIYDTEKPTTPSSIQLLDKASNIMRIAWSKASDNQKLAGYNFYVNGQKYNSQSLTDTMLVLDDLTANTKYTFAVTAIDNMGNESELSAWLTETTHPLDETSPTAPTDITTDIAASMALQISWSGATDETAIFGYNVYVDGELYNTDDYVYENNLIIKPLTPDNSYEIKIQTVDAGLNTSPKSDAYTASTTTFDPSSNTLGVDMGQLTIAMNPVGINEGLGINPLYIDGEFLETVRQDAITELRPANIRWGGIGANNLRFDNYIGDDKNATIADFAHLCIQNNAYMSFTCGMEETTDWITDENTFLHFLEYLGGPSTSTYGEIRANEGYTEPLLNQLKGLIFEFGNEVWGASHHFAPIGEDYSEYGDWARDIAEKMKTSPYFDENLIRFTYSGRNPNPNRSYGLNEKLLKEDTGQVDILALGGYIGANFDGAEIDQGDSYLDYFKNCREDAFLDISGLDYYNKLSIKLTGEFKPGFFYETNTKNDAYNGRTGHAMIITDYWLAALEKGAIVPTIYSLSHGQWRITAPGEDFKRLPVFKTAKLINKYTRGHILETDYNSQSTLSDADGNLIEGDGVGTYAYSNEETYNIVLISRDFQNAHYVEIDLPDDFSFQSTAKKYTITADDFSSFDAVVDSSDISLSDNYLVEVPAYSMVLIRFTGDNQNFEDLKPGYFSYKKQEQIEITAETTEITSNSGKVTLNAEITPEDAYIEAVDWKIIDNSVNATLFKFDKSCWIKASGHISGNGTITVRAFALDDPDVYDEIDVTISGQVGIENRKTEDIFAVYPNPAKTQFNLQLTSNIVPQASIKIYDLSGRCVHEFTNLAPNQHISFGEELQSGVYILSYESKDKRLNSMIVKQ